MITIQNRLWWPIRGLMLHDLQGESLVSIKDVPSSGKFSEEIRLPLNKRGIFDSRSLRLETNYPFGLMLATRSVEVIRPLIVWPKPAAIPTEIDNGGTVSVFGSNLHARSGTSGDFSGLRPLREGERLRRVSLGPNRTKRSIDRLRDASFLVPYLVDLS